jgi:hypothetical protein
MLLFLIAALALVFGCKGTVQPQESRTDSSGNTYTAPETATPKTPVTRQDTGTPPEGGGTAKEVVASDEVPLPAALETTPQPVESSIETVTVYSDRAAITRKAKVNLKEGAYDLVFSKLPPNIIDDSVRARGSEKIRVVNVKIEREHLLQPDAPEIVKLEAQIKEKAREIATNNDQLAALAKREALLDSIRMRSGEKASQQMEGNIDPKKVGEMMDFLDEKYTKLATDRLALNETRETLRKDMDLLSRQMADQRSKLTLDNIKAIVTVIVNADTAEDVPLDYLASGAGWQAEYDLRASSKDETAELSYYGVVGQVTGEDWTNVQLFLSTSDPRINVLPPTLSVWNIGPAQPQVSGSTFAIRHANAPAKMTYNSTMQGTEEATKEAPAPALEPMVEGKLTDVDKTKAVQELQKSLQQAGQNAVIRQQSGDRSGVGVTFAIPRKETVITGKEPHRTLIAVRRLHPQNTFIAMPRVEQKVYMRAEITNDTPFTLLPGKMSVFSGADFVGNTQISDVAPGQIFRVNFGVDQGIKIKRERIRKFSEDAGFRGKTRRITYEYKITLENFKPVDVTVKVVDQIPVSTSGDVVVKLISTNFPTTTEEPTASDNKEKGMLEWQAKLPPDPNRKNEIVYKYTVEYPKDMPITGEE